MALLLRTLADALIAFGPFGVLLIGFFDSLGIPLPAALDALLLTIAIKAPQHAYYAAVLAVVGSMAGNYVLFHAARYGLLTVFVPAVVPFVPLPLKVFVISAGAMRTHTSRFLGVIFVARVIRYFGQAWLATRLGQDARGFLTHNAWNMAAVVLTMALALVAVIKWYDRRRAEEA